MKQTNREDELEKYVYFSGDTYVVDVLDVRKLISLEREKMIEEIKKLKVKVDYSLPTTDYNWSDHDIDNAKNEGIEMAINLLQK